MADNGQSAKNFNNRLWYAIEEAEAEQLPYNDILFLLRVAIYEVQETEKLKSLGRKETDNA